MRLEEFLQDRFRGLSKLYLRDLVKSEKCEVNGRYENIGYRLRSDDFIEIELDPARENAMLPQDIPLDIIYEDHELIVVNKPTGMLVHPSHRDKTGTLLNALVFHTNRTMQQVFIRPGLIHRLDKETSGLIVAAKTPRAHSRLSSHFERRLVKKRYLALVSGQVHDDHGIVTGNIGRFTDEKRWGLKSDGRPSTTNYWVRERSTTSTLLELEPVTGRTNQLRIHCAALGHPIIGDVERGGGVSDRLYLHAHKLAFHHPADTRFMEFVSNAPFHSRRESQK